MLGGLVVVVRCGGLVGVVIIIEDFVVLFIVWMVVVVSVFGVVDVGWWCWVFVGVVLVSCFGWVFWFWLEVFRKWVVVCFWVIIVRVGLVVLCVWWVCWWCCWCFRIDWCGFCWWWFCWYFGLLLDGLLCCCC